MARTAKSKTPAPQKEADLPPGWRHGQRAERIEALRLLPRRVRVLLAAEWARSVLPVFEAKRPGDDRPRKAIETAERWAAEPGDENRKAAADAADAAAYAADAAAQKQRWLWLHETFRRAGGPEGVTFDPRWRTPAAVGIARAVVVERAFDRLPVLADAVEEAGCDDPRILALMREPSDAATCADWPVWQLLGFGDDPTQE